MLSYLFLFENHCYTRNIVVGLLLAVVILTGTFSVCITTTCSALMPGSALTCRAFLEELEI